MKRFLTLLIFIGFCYSTIFPQVDEVENYQDKEPRKIFMNTHDPNLKSFPEKSFYKSRDDWQYIIDTTWGSGLPFAQKQQVFNMFTTSLSNSFDGFLSLGMTWASWDSLKDSCYTTINSTTSRGRFAAIMHYLCSKMRDGHTWCDDLGVLNTPLNPGVPFLMFTGMVDTKHFGAVTTVLPDSSVMVLRVVNNHPLNLEPGDIILGYEGIPWKDLIVELMDAELPNNDFWGGYEGTYTDHLFIGAGMNWHLFDIMDVLKHSTGDTVHLSVAPLITLNVPSMMNNEQIEIPNIPFPDYFNNDPVSYGILNNTNIGYIYVVSEGLGNAELEFNQAVVALQNTDALIIDMRWNEGGFAMWQDAFKILSNESIYTLKSAIRCSPSNFDLCPTNDQGMFQIIGSGPTKYDKPIAVLLGPNCLSNGDWNAYRLSYLYNVRTFGKSTWASLGMNQFPAIPAGWMARISTHDVFRVNNPGIYLNRREFPIDFPVWHNPDDAAIGKDAVVDNALDWINNLVYPHNTITDKLTYSLGEDSVHLSTIIENPNSHQLSARAYLKTLEGVIIDSVNLVKQTLNPDGENWTASLNLPPAEEFYKIALTVFDQTTSDNFTVPNATRFTTAGPAVLDSIYWTQLSTFFYSVKPFVKNQSTVTTITNASVKLICNDPWVTSVNPSSLALPDISPGAIVSPSNGFIVRIDTTIFPEYFNFNVEIMSDGWAFWTDSMRIPPVAMISINPTELDFGEVAIDSSAKKTFTITNYGDEDLLISNISSSEPVFTVNITSAVVLPDSSKDVEVTFTPTGLLSFSGKIEITHNAAGSPDSVIVIGEGVTGVEEELQPLTFSLEQNYPNPFNPTTTIKYSIPELSKVILKLFNLLGEEVATLVNEEKVAGYYTVAFNAASLPSGIYFYQLKAGNFVETKKMILLK